MARTLSGKLLKAASLSLLNQVISSASNFALGLYLVRALSARDFGLYNIAFAVSLFIYGFGNAALLNQMVVNTPDKSIEDRPRYWGRMLALAILMAGGVVAVLAGVGPVLRRVVNNPSVDVTYLMLTGAASASYLLKDFFVRHAYNVLDEALALRLNLTLLFGLVGLLLLSFQTTTPLTVDLALTIYAAAHLLSAFHGFLASGLSLRGVAAEDLRSDLAEAWRGGGAACVTNVLFFGRAHSHTIIVTGLLGAATLGAMNASRLLVTPAVLAFPAIHLIALPRMSRARSDNAGSVGKQVVQLAALLLLIAVLYGLVVIKAHSYFVEFVLGAEYADTLPLVIAWCIYTCVMALRNAFDLGNQVFKRFGGIMRANVLVSVISLGGTFVLATLYGATGAIAGMIVAEAVLAVILALMLRHSSARLASTHSDFVKESA